MHEFFLTVMNCLQLFEALDTDNTGYVDRHRMLHLLEKFWDKVEDNHKEIRNPRRCTTIYFCEPKLFSFI